MERAYTGKLNRISQQKNQVFSKITSIVENMTNPVPEVPVYMLGLLYAFRKHFKLSFKLSCLLLDNLFQSEELFEFVDTELNHREEVFTYLREYLRTEQVTAKI